jgi:CDP-glucose 4,6-dehydratase
MKFLLTGHTGFKGTWLLLYLKCLGHSVTGLSLDPIEPSFFTQVEAWKYLDKDYRVDIRDLESVTEIASKCNPDVIVHLAAQAIVSLGYEKPIDTFATNIIGTINVLEASRQVEDLKSILIVTSDKVYRPTEHSHPNLETDCLGGKDPYSASKASQDLVAQSWRASYPSVPLSIARAGNVIGGGDWSQNRLIPDIVRAINNDAELCIRNPNAIRPWQYVMDCLNGYVTLIDAQLRQGIQGEWNFSPLYNENLTVQSTYETFLQKWNASVPIKLVDSKYEENNVLVINSKKARSELGWREKLSFDEMISWTVEWYKHASQSDITMKQVERFMSL